MTTPHDDDRDIDAFLRGEDGLSALLRQAPQPEVPADLDARIRAQAREALRQPAQPDAAANDPVIGPARAPWLTRVRVPLGLAATVVLGLSMSLHWNGRQEQAPVAVLSDSVPAAEQKPQAPGAAAPVGTQDSPAAAARPAAKAPAAHPQAPKRAAAVPAEEALPVPMPPPPPPPAAPAPMALPAPAPAPGPIYYRSAPARVPPTPFAPAAPAPAAPAPAPAPTQQATPEPSNRIEVTGSRIARPAAPATDPRAEQWLALLTELLDRHLDDDARDSWQQFRREFPDYPVPAALQARIDALQPGR